MEKAQIVPIYHAKIKEVLNKMTKDELLEAGVNTDYLDEYDEIINELFAENTKKKGNFKESKKWMLLMILMFFVTSIIQLGTVHINYEKSNENNHLIIEEFEMITNQIT